MATAFFVLAQLLFGATAFLLEPCTRAWLLKVNQAAMLLALMQALKFCSKASLSAYCIIVACKA